MKYLIILTLWLSVACSPSEENKDTLQSKKEPASSLIYFPKSKDILKEFKTRYTTVTFTGNDRKELSIVKKKDGYYLAVSTHKNGKKVVLDELIFWTQEGYRELNISKYFIFNDPNGMNPQGIILSNEHDFRNGYFDIYPVYAYDGWYYDVIDMLGNQKTLSDTLLYAYARAMDTKVLNEFTCGQFGYSSDENCYELLNKNGQNALDEPTLERYLKERNDVLKIFKRLVAQNPDFKTIVGSISTKTANTVMDLYLTLDYYQNEKTARDNVGVCFYEPSILASAKNMLLSCPDNSILFTFGDNDTYPLLYHQTKNNLRRDVRIVNLSLANVPRYISRLREPHMVAGGILLSISDEVYNDENNGYFVFPESSNHDQRIDANDLNKAIINSTSHRQNEQIKVLQSNLFSCKRGDDFLMEWECSDNYLTKATLMVYDAIASNPYRSFVFSSGGTKRMLMGLEDFIQQEGVVNVLHSEQNFCAGHALTVNQAKTFSLFMESYDLENILGNSKTSRLHGNYALMMGFFADQLKTDEAIDSAVQISDKRMSFVKSYEDLTLSDDLFLSVYFAANQTETASSLVNDLMKHHLSEFDKLLEQLPADAEQTIITIAHSTFRIHQLCAENNLVDLANSIKDSISDMDDKVNRERDNPSVNLDRAIATFEKHSSRIK